MGRGWRIGIGLVALALVVVAAISGFRLLRADGGADASSEPGFVVDGLDCLDGIYANTDFALDGDDGGNFVVCHYDKLPMDPSTGMSHELAASSELSAAESALVRQAIQSAPRGEQPFTGCETGDDSPGEFFLVRTPTQVAFWVYNAECGDNGVLAIGANGKLVHRHDTAAVLEALGSTYGPLGPDFKDDCRGCNLPGSG